MDDFTNYDRLRRQGATPNQVVKIALEDNIHHRLYTCSQYPS